MFEPQGLKAFGGQILGFRDTSDPGSHLEAAAVGGSSRLDSNKRGHRERDSRNIFRDSLPGDGALSPKRPDQQTQMTLQASYVGSVPA